MLLLGGDAAAAYTSDLAARSWHGSLATMWTYGLCCKAALRLSWCTSASRGHTSGWSCRPQPMRCACGASLQTCAPLPSPFQVGWERVEPLLSPCCTLTTWLVKMQCISASSLLRNRKATPQPYPSPFALAPTEVMQHLLGDIPTPPALGAMQGAVDNWRLSLAGKQLGCALAQILKWLLHAVGQDDMHARCEQG